MSNARFVSSIRTRGIAHRLVPEGYAGPVWSLRVQLLDAWDAVRVDAAPTTPVDVVIRAALATLAGADATIDAYDCKVRGVRIAKLDQSLASAGIADGSTLLLATAARLPVR
jgi:hypothetical protein